MPECRIWLTGVDIRSSLGTKLQAPVIQRARCITFKPSCIDVDTMQAYSLETTCWFNGPTSII